MGAVAIQLDFPGATLEQYEAVLEKMGLQPGGAGPPGALFHWAAQTADGLRVTDVWESREVFDQFAETQIGPFTQEVGITTPPTIQYFDVYSYLTGPR